MPHYEDGTEAKVGDLVIGKPCNTPRLVVGEVVQVTPGDTCNLIVMFAARVHAPNVDTLTAPGHLGGLSVGYSNEGRFLMRAHTDYGETKAFRKVG